MFPDPVQPRSCPAHTDTMAGVFPMDDVVLDGCETSNGHDNFSDDDCIEVGSSVTDSSRSVSVNASILPLYCRLKKVCMPKDQISLR